MDAENRWLSNTTSTDFDPFANGIEDHASNLPLAAARSLQIVDNLRYMLGIELMHAAQAIDLRRDQRLDNRLQLGRVTGPLKEDFRTVVPYYAEDRNLSVDMEKAYQYIRSGRLLSVLESADQEA